MVLNEGLINIADKTESQRLKILKIYKDFQRLLKNFKDLQIFPKISNNVQKFQTFPKIYVVIKEQNWYIYRETLKGFRQLYKTYTPRNFV